MSRHDRDHASARIGGTSGELRLGRESYRRHAFGDAFRSLSVADRAQPLGGDDLDLLATSAALLGRDEDARKALERAHQAYLEAGDGVRAARAALWLVFRLLARGETGRANGWLTRAKRLLEGGAHDCVEQGYLLLPAARQQLAANDCEAAYATAAAAAGIGIRFGDADLVAFSRSVQGRALMRQGRIDEGVALLDEAMVAVAAREVSPLLTGVIYCSVIDCCQQVYALGRAREWTSALAEWCEEQPDVVAFTGACRVHRAEIMQLSGDWREAIEEARRAAEGLQKGFEPKAAAAAFYQQAEVHRLRGEFAEAENDYRRANSLGLEPQPGLALLRLARGRADAAAAQIRRVVAATTDRMQRTRLLPAFVEILLAVGDVEEALGACRELEETAEAFSTDVLAAMAAHARGAVELARGDARAASGPLRRSFELWQRVGVPYIAARLRVLVGLACRAVGDDDGAELELGAARAVFEELGAAPDLASIEALAKGTRPARPHGLTSRELQVLRLVAAGKTNKTIAAELFLSEKTVDRHMSNIFTKLDVSSRSAATAFAYEHRLL
ncbi:MAG TPA: response regulator transcription factor [Thermoanaerobaculia bacterium]|nr:response regulator transcription factor [Thermoanaerobaculia bacterium]